MERYVGIILCQHFFLPSSYQVIILPLTLIYAFGVDNGEASDEGIVKAAIIGLIVSITKFSIVIGSPCAYLSRNRRAITWVSNYRCPI